MTDSRIDEILAALGRPGRVFRHPAPRDLAFVATPSGRMAYEAEGAGPAVLLVHGWQGGARDFAALKLLLHEAGARTVTPDLPAHGDSEGETVTARSAAEALIALARAEGPFAAVIAHSFGCPATTLALDMGMAARALVFVAPPAEQSDQLMRLCRRNGLSDDEARSVLATAQARGAEFVSIPALARARHEPLLILHAPEDPMTPFEGAQAIAAAWPGAKLLPADGLGHNGPLRDRAMTGAMVRFALG